MFHHHWVMVLRMSGQPATKTCTRHFLPHALSSLHKNYPVLTKLLHKHFAVRGQPLVIVLKCTSSLRLSELVLFWGWLIAPTPIPIWPKPCPAIWSLTPGPKRYSTSFPQLPGSTWNHDLQEQFRSKVSKLNERYESVETSSKDLLYKNLPLPYDFGGTIFIGSPIEDQLALQPKWHSNQGLQYSSRHIPKGETLGSKKIHKKPHNLSKIRWRIWPILPRNPMLLDTIPQNDRQSLDGLATPKSNHAMKPDCIPYPSPELLLGEQGVADLPNQEWSKQRQYATINGRTCFRALHYEMQFKAKTCWLGLLNDLLSSSHCHVSTCEICLEGIHENEFSISTRIAISLHPLQIFAIACTQGHQTAGTSHAWCQKTLPTSQCSACWSWDAKNS